MLALTRPMRAPPQTRAPLNYIPGPCATRPLVLQELRGALITNYTPLGQGLQYVASATAYRMYKHRLDVWQKLAFVLAVRRWLLHHHHKARIVCVRSARAPLVTTTLAHLGRVYLDENGLGSGADLHRRLCRGGREDFKPARYHPIQGPSGFESHLYQALCDTLPPLLLDHAVVFSVGR